MNDPKPADHGAELHAFAAVWVVGFAFFGYLREVHQHDWTLTIHQWIEALAWPAGAIAVAVAVLLGVHLWRRLRGTR